MLQRLCKLVGDLTWLAANWKKKKKKNYGLVAVVKVIGLDIFY